LLLGVKAHSSDLVVVCLRDPERIRAFSAFSWELLILQARSAGLLARIATLLEKHALLDHVPRAPAAHLLAARTVAAAQQDEVRREVAHITGALRSLSVPAILLKGTAYLLAGLPASLGRTFSDVDMLVPKSRLAEVEAALMLAGWATTHHSDYDQRYYRTWMHELPPLQHIRRQTMLDVHHAILPETARLKPPSSKLLEAAQPLEGHAGLSILCPPDIVLHSMAHLFHNEEMSHGLRDLSDLDLLLRHFGERPGFWEQLLERSRELDLERPLYYGLHQAHAILGTPVPISTLAISKRAAPAWPLRSVMDRLWSEALRPPHRSCRGAITGMSLFALYIRAHWLRMPPKLLARHLAVKAMTRPH
jgi:hypothetical protein